MSKQVSCSSTYGGADLRKCIFAARGGGSTPGAPGRALAQAARGRRVLCGPERCLHLLVFPQPGVCHDGPDDRREITERGKGMVHRSGEVLIPVEEA